MGDFFFSVNTIGFSYPLHFPFRESPNGNVEFGDAKDQLTSNVSGGFLMLPGAAPLSPGLLRGYSTPPGNTRHSM